MKINLFIPIETASREITYKIFLCNYLASRGFRCYLGSKTNINYLVKKTKNYFYIDKGYHKGVSEKIYSIVKKNKGMVVNLDEEGGVDYSSGSTLLDRYSKVLFDNADLVFLWGVKQLELIKKNVKVNKNIIVSGHPRFELLKPKFHFLYKDDIKKINNRYDNFILVNTNMGFGNNIRGDQFVKDNYRDRFNNINQIINADKKKLEAYKSLIKNLSKKQNKTIIIRPHPEEDHAFYLNSFEGYNNVQTVYDGSVVPWILASDVMIHPDCTTAIEAYFLGKKSLSFIPKNISPDLLTHLPLTASKCFLSEDDITTYIINARRIHYNRDDKHRLLDEYFSISKKSMYTIVDQIVELKKDFKVKENQKLKINHLINLKFRELKLLFSKDPSVSLAKNKLDGFNFKNATDTLNLINQEIGNSCNIAAKKITNHLFVIDEA